MSSFIIRNNPLMPDVLKIGDDVALANSHMNFSDPTVIFFHAFFESSMGTTSWIIKTAYLHKKQHNLILLNAPRLQAGPWYITASRNTKVVGEYSAKFIDYLISRGMPLQSLHLVGLSLGAQMAGVAGSNVRSGRVPRITGLDPAGPLFTKLPNSLKLDKGDAEFVDVIHTDAGIFGYPRAIGHADFWPNRGISPQPGCNFPEVKRRNPDTILELFFCSHWRSYQFYAESVVNENGFFAVYCNNWNEFVSGNCTEQEPIRMGYAAPETARGNYYLVTNPESPYSREGNPQTLADTKYSVNQYSVSKSQIPFGAKDTLQTTAEGAYQGSGYYYPTATEEPQQHIQANGNSEGYKYQQYDNSEVHKPQQYIQSNGNAEGYNYGDRYYSDRSSEADYYGNLHVPRENERYQQYYYYYSY